MTFDPVPEAGGRFDARALELVWLGPVLLAVAATLLTTDRFVLVAPLLVVAVVPWVLQAVGRPVSLWLFGVLAIPPVVVILIVQGLNASVFLGTTALCLLASRAARAWQLGAVAVIAVALPFTSAFSPLPFDPGSFYFAIGDLFGVAVGVLLGYALRLAAELRVADEALHAAHAQQERTRLARDVHDLVAHSLTVAVLHIGGARRLLATDSAAAVAALTQAEDVCRDSLDGIRQVVGLLRSEDDLPSGTGDVLALVDTYRTAGMGVEVDLDPRLHELPVVVRSIVRRITQEALANAARYRSPDATVTVTCRIDDTEVTLVVSNAAPARRQVSRGGFGLTGLSEQVLAAGGTLTNGYRDGCWYVTCALPLHAAEAVAR